MFQFDLKKAQDITPEDKGGEFVFCTMRFEIKFHPFAILHINVGEIGMQAHNAFHFTAILWIKISPSVHKNSLMSYCSINIHDSDLSESVVEVCCV